MSLSDFITSFLPSQQDLMPPLITPSVLAQLQALQPQQQGPQLPQGGMPQQDPSALGQYSPQQSQQPDFGSALARVAAATNGADSLQKYDTGQQLLQGNQALAQYASQQKGDPLAQLAAAAPAVAGKTYAEALAKKQELQLTNPFASIGGGQSGPLAGLSGQELLQKLPPQVASTIKAYGEYKVPFNPRLAATPQGQQLLGMITQAYPDYNVENSQKIHNTVKDFAPGGKSRQNINSIETAINTLSQLQDSSDKLGGPQYLNSIRNAALSGQSDPNLVDYQTKAKTAADEVTKAVVGAGGTGGDRNTREKSFTENQSPEARKSAITAAIGELNARLDPLATAYSTGLSKPVGNIELLSPKAQANYQKIMGIAPDNATAGKDAPQAAQPTTAPTIQEGQTATNPKTGAKLVFKNGKWKPA